MIAREWIPRTLALAALALTLGCGRADQPKGLNPFDLGADRPPTAMTLYAMAQAMIEAGDDERGEGLLTAVIHEEPSYLRAYLALAEIQKRQGRIREAIATLRRGLEAAPGDPVLLNALGVCMLLREDFNRAAELFAEAAEAWPGDARFQANLALALGMLGRDEEARQTYGRLMPSEEVEHNMQVIRRARRQTIPAVRLDAGRRED